MYSSQLRALSRVLSAAPFLIVKNDKAYDVNANQIHYPIKGFKNPFVAFASPSPINPSKMTTSAEKHMEVEDPNESEKQEEENVKTSEEEQENAGNHSPTIRTGQIIVEGSLGSPGSPGSINSQADMFEDIEDCTEDYPLPLLEESTSEGQSTFEQSGSGTKKSKLSSVPCIDLTPKSPQNNAKDYLFYTIPLDDDESKLLENSVNKQIVLSGMTSAFKALTKELKNESPKEYISGTYKLLPGPPYLEGNFGTGSSKDKFDDIYKSATIRAHDNAIVNIIGTNRGKVLDFSEDYINEPPSASGFAPSPKNSSPLHQIPSEEKPKENEKRKANDSPELKHTQKKSKESKDIKDSTGMSMDSCMEDNPFGNEGVVGGDEHVAGEIDENLLRSFDDFIEGKEEEKNTTVKDTYWRMNNKVQRNLLISDDDREFIRLLEISMKLRDPKKEYQYNFESLSGVLDEIRQGRNFTDFESPEEAIKFIIKLSEYARDLDSNDEAWAILNGDDIKAKKDKIYELFGPKIGKPVTTAMTIDQRKGPAKTGLNWRRLNLCITLIVNGTARAFGKVAPLDYGEKVREHWDKLQAKINFLPLSPGVYTEINFKLPKELILKKHKNLEKIYIDRNWERIEHWHKENPKLIYGFEEDLEFMFPLNMYKRKYSHDRQLYSIAKARVKNPKAYDELLSAEYQDKLRSAMNENKQKGDKVGASKSKDNAKPKKVIVKKPKPKATLKKSTIPGPSKVEEDQTKSTLTPKVSPPVMSCPGPVEQTEAPIQPSFDPVKAPSKKTAPKIPKKNSKGDGQTPDSSQNQSRRFTRSQALAMEVVEIPQTKEMEEKDEEIEIVSEFAEDND